MDIEEIGPGLRYAEAKPVKNPKQGANVGTPPLPGMASPPPTRGDVRPPEPQSDEPRSDDCLL